MDETPFQHVQRMLPEDKESRVRGHLGRFGFSGDRGNTLVSNLSGGEKARLLFALMSCGKPNILLLDEPTNHLDVDAREALVHALNAFEGAVILVSHDAHLIELVADRLWLVADGTCAPYDGTLADYAAELQTTRRKARQSDKPANNGDAPRDTKKQARKDRAEQRQLTAKLRKTVKESEAEMAKLASKCATIEAKLADPSIYDGPTSDLMDLQLKHAEAKDALAAVESAWMEAQEALEGAA